MWRPGARFHAVPAGWLGCPPAHQVFRERLGLRRRRNGFRDFSSCCLSRQRQTNRPTSRVQAEGTRMGNRRTQIRSSRAGRMAAGRQAERPISGRRTPRPRLGCRLESLDSVRVSGGGSSVSGRADNGFRGGGRGAIGWAPGPARARRPMPARCVGLQPLSRLRRLADSESCRAAGYGGTRPAVSRPAGPPDSESPGPAGNLPLDRGTGRVTVAQARGHGGDQGAQAP